jgi:hypothetical protein
MINDIYWRKKIAIEDYLYVSNYNLLGISAVFAIPIAIILVCIRLFLLKGKVSLILIMLVVIETILLAMILFDVCNMYTNVFGD